MILWNKREHSVNRSSLFLRSSRVFSAFFSAPLWGAIPLVTILTGCTTNLSPGSLIKTNTIPASIPNSGTSDGSNQGAFLITRALLDRTFTSLINVVGDQSGAIGNFCDSTNGATGTNGNEAVCACTFSYNTPSAPNQQVDVPIVYQETDLIRCPIAGVPADATQISVSIHVTGADLYSNSIIYSPGAASTVIDTTNPDSFIKVTRFQCRDKVWIPYVFDNAIYDPYQSEDPHLTYPLDFYTTNLGATIAKYAAGVDNHQGLEYWDCPPILTPQDYLDNDHENEDAYSNRFNLNMKVYSWEPLNGNNQIYPPVRGLFDRSTFYLAKKSSGAFTIPINAYIAPMIISGGQDYPDSLGYGVRPIVSSTGGIDQCLTDVPIPPGYHWVKVWLFRAALPSRQYILPSDLGPESLNDIAAILCNPGVWTDINGASTKTSIFPSCNNYSSADSATPFIYANTDSKSYIMNADWPSQLYLSSRVISYDSSNLADPSSCVNLQNYKGNDANHYPGDSSLNGTETTPQQCKLIYNNNDNTINNTSDGSIEGTGCGGTQPNDLADYWKINLQPISRGHDPLNIHNTPGNPTKLWNTPRNTALKTGTIDTDSNRYDFLFVVTPPSVSLTQMVDTTPGSIGRQYQPYRFFLASDCPNNSEGCETEHNAISTYGIKRHDVGTNGDTPPSGTTTPWIFPVCAIQPDIPEAY
jgi:hypothetical protein